jgi:hypothetical protein
MNDIIEAWMPITGHEDLYSISSCGRVRSESKIVARRNGANYTKPQAIMRPGFGESLYRTVGLVNADGVRTTHYVHTLVLEHFVSPRPAGLEGCHGDGDRSNNAAGNLRWDTRSGNHADKNAHGTSPIGERHPMRKLDDKTVLAIRARRAEGASATRLSEEFNVSRMTAFRAATGRSWSHLP